MPMVAPACKAVVGYSRSMAVNRRVDSQVRVPPFQRHAVLQAVESPQSNKFAELAFPVYGRG